MNTPLPDEPSKVFPPLTPEESDSPSSNHSEAPAAAEPFCGQPAHAPSPSNGKPAPASPSLDIPLCVLFYELQPGILHEFIRFFQNDLLAKYPDLPHPSPEDHAFADAVAPLLTSADKLPPRMFEALLAIQELATESNRQLLRGLLAQSGIRAHPSTPPEQLALRFWLQCPFQIGRLKSLRAQLPDKYLVPPQAQSPDGSNAQFAAAANPDTLSASPDPFDVSAAEHSPPAAIPGDLAALARFPRHKIAQLPPDVRASINHLLRQRIPYLQIIQKLGDHGKTLNKSNVSRWKKTGYLVWLAEQQHREDAQTQLQLLFDLVRENENGKIHEATQQIAALRISQLLAGLDPAALLPALQQHPQALVRLVQTLPSLSRGGMDCERLLLELTARKASLRKHDDSKPRGISDQTLKYLEQKLKLL